MGTHPSPPLLKLPGFRPLLVAEIVGTIGTELTMVALPWLVLTTTGSAAHMGWVMAAQLIPIALFGPIGGKWAARMGPRRWMIMSDICRGVLIAAIPILFFTDLLPLPALLGIVFTIGVFTAPYLASQQTIVAKLFGDNEVTLGEATSLLQGAVRTALLVGAPIGAGLVAALGAPSVLVINAVTSLTTAFIIWKFVPTRSETQKPSTFPRISDRWQALTHDRLLVLWTGGTILTEAAWQALFVGIPVLALTRYGGNVGAVGLALGAFGAGSLLGSLAATWAVRRYSLIALSTIGKVTQGLLFGLLLLDLSPIALAACLLFAGLFNGVSNGPAAAIRLLRIPAPLRPQTLSLISSITQIGGSLGLIVGGFAFAAIGNQATLTGMFVVQVVGFSLFILGSQSAHKTRGLNKPDDPLPPNDLPPSHRPPRLWWRRF